MTSYHGGTMGYAMGEVAPVLMETTGTPYGGESAASGERGGRDGERGAAPRAPVWSSEEVEELDALESEVAVIAGHIHAITRRFFSIIARFVEKGGWRRGGHRTPAHWLSVVASVDLVTCREYIRVAKALEALPETGAAMARGALSYSKVRALTRVAKPETEGDLLPVAEGVTVAVLERLVRGWKTSERLDEVERERVRRESRTYSIYPDGDGMYEIRGRVPAEAGAQMMRTLEAASDSLYRDRNPVPVPPEASAREAAKRRADAAELVFLRAAAAGFGPHDPNTLSGMRAERYQVMLHVEPGTLREDGEPGMSELEDGTRVSAETARRVCCDASLVRVTKDAAGNLLDVGRKTRTVPPGLRRALEVRDRGCRFPGCGMRFTARHHVHHWADGGATNLGNLILLCGFHHTLVHEGGWKVEWWGPGSDRRAAFRDPRGQLHVGAPARPPKLGEDPVESALQVNRERGVDPGAFTAGARWEFEREIPDEVLFRATEAAL